MTISTLPFMSGSQVQFFDCRLSLIHIPLDIYPHFVQVILKLALPISPVLEKSQLFETRSGFGFSGFSPADSPRGCREFVNISITPVECSIVCSVESAESLFRPIIGTLDDNVRDKVVISEDEYVVIQVDGDDGNDAGQRVLDVTSPLALAGISIFFITTYFSDYILLPSKSSSKVTKALLQRGFVFEKHSEMFVTHRRSSSTPSVTSNGTAPPLTPPPSTTVAELQEKTFDTLKDRNVTPKVNLQTRLVRCAARRAPGKAPSGISDDERLYLGVVKCLVNQPQYLSITLTDANPASLLIQEDKLPLFGADDVLLGDKEEILIPILLDLRDFPVDSTGIVCGVAGRLYGKTYNGLFPDCEPVDMSYLSTARAGTVMVLEADIDRAMKALEI